MIFSFVNQPAWTEAVEGNSIKTEILFPKTYFLFTSLLLLLLTMIILIITSKELYITIQISFYYLSEFLQPTYKQSCIIPMLKWRWDQERLYNLLRVYQISGWDANLNFLAFKVSLFPHYNTNVCKCTQWRQHMLCSVTSWIRCCREKKRNIQAMIFRKTEFFLEISHYPQEDKNLWKFVEPFPFCLWRPTLVHFLLGLSFLFSAHFNSTGALRHHVRSLCF